MPAKSLLVRFNENYVVNQITGCWIWTGWIDRKHSRWGYGLIDVAGANVGAHRVSYELFRGPIPDGLWIDHLCWNTRCVNPAHLEPVTPKENSKRAIRTRREHCVNGHLLAGDNVYRDPKGHRECVACRKEQWLSFRERHGLPYKTAAEIRLKHPRTRLIEANGESKTLAEWAISLGLTKVALKARIRKGMNMAEAVTLPRQSSSNR